MGKSVYNFSFEDRIIHQLLLRAGMEPDCGLFHGKMGLALFFFIYSRQKDEELFNIVGHNLLDDIWENLTVDTSINLENGLCGIAWGIEYLLQNGYKDGSGSDICEDIDNAVISKRISKINDLSIESGVGGIMYYIMARLKGSMLRKEPYPFDQILLGELMGSANKILIESKDEKLKTLAANFLNFLSSNTDYNPDIGDFINAKIKVSINRIDSALLGIHTGLSGYILTNLLMKGNETGSHN